MAALRIALPGIAQRDGLALEPAARGSQHPPTKEQPQCDHNLGPDAAEGRPKGLPNLAKMARQYLGRPASSAGVERLFSKAGKLYGDDKKRQADKSLEAALSAFANTE